MSLRVWLPLNGDLRNNGLDDVTVTNNGATVDSSGKLGSCYYFDGNDDYINLGNISHYFDGSPFSITFWIKSEEDGTRGIIFSAYGLSSTSNFFALEINGSSGTLDNYLRFDWLGVDIKFFQSAVTPNTWLHFAVVYDGTKVICYRNGELYGDKTYTLSPIPTGNNYYLGRDSRTGATAFKGRLNDFRLYDHALSLKEVKEISKGLVLHYPLNNGSMGLPNLISYSDFDISPWNTAIINRGMYEGKYAFYVRNNTLYTNTGNGTTSIFPSITFKENTQYTISVWWRDDYRTDNKSSSLYLRFKYTDGTATQIISPSYTLKEWKYDTLTSTAGKTVSMVTTTYGNGGVLVLSNLKIEEGATATAYSIKSEENIIYDCSGFENNGILTNLSYNLNSIKYNNSTFFDGDTAVIALGNISNLLQNEFTVNLWFKKD